MFKLNLETGHFIDEYWQKKPLLIKGAFPEFIDPISPEELAGLAMESEPDSRIVAHKDEQWQLIQGPIEDFSLLSSQLGDKNWSLLIQGVDHWHEDCAKLTQAFHFLPCWRFDDLMVTYATPGGGVGPHIDNYDVFIIQGLGKRHWRVGSKGAAKLKTVISGLQHCEAFSAIIDAHLECGDMLYIPAGCPHEGVTESEALSYSIGYRAPDQTQLFGSLADYLAEHHHLKTEFYQDPKIGHDLACGALKNNELNQLKQLALSLLDNNNLVEQWLGASLSRSRHDLDLAPTHMDIETLDNAFTTNKTLQRLYGLKCLYLENNAEKLFVEGESFLVSKELSQLLCDQASIKVQQYHSLDEHCKKQLLDFVQRGYWYF